MSRVPFRTRVLKKGGYAKRAIVDYMTAGDQEELLVDFEMSHTEHPYEGVCPNA